MLHAKYLHAMPPWMLRVLQLPPLARPGKRFNQSKDKWFQYQMSPTHSMSLPEDWRLMQSFHSHKHPHFNPIPVKGNNQWQIKHHDPIPGMPIYISLPSTLKVTMTLPLKTTMTFSWPKETMKALPCLALWSHHSLPFALNTTQVNHVPSPLIKESQHDFPLPPNQIIPRLRNINSSPSWHKQIFV